MIYALIYLAGMAGTAALFGAIEPFDDTDKAVMWSIFWPLALVVLIIIKAHNFGRRLAGKE